jgi:SAM-dependent methyltransferase
MDAATVAVYERNALEWRQRRGDATDGLGLDFRDKIGMGLAVDLGCGTGRYLKEIARPVLGLDVTTRMLSLARPMGFPLVQADLERLPFADSFLAGLFARHSYLHVHKAQLAGALVEARRVLRPGGLLLVTLIEGSYHGHDLPDDDFPGRYFACWTEPVLTAALAAAGFVDIDVAHIDRRGGAPDLLATARR